VLGDADSVASHITGCDI